MIFWAKYEPISAQQSPNWIQGKTNAVLYLLLHIPSGSEQSKQILAESKWILVNSDNIPTSVLPHKKKGSKSHSELVQVISESFRPTGRNQKFYFFTKSKSKIPSRFRVNSDHIPTIPSPSIPKSKLSLSQISHSFLCTSILILIL